MIQTIRELHDYCLLRCKWIIIKRGKLTGFRSELWI